VTIRHPSIREVLGDPLTHWRLASIPPPSRARPVIALSRLPGAQGDEVARALGEELGLHVYDREIIQRIAESAHLSERAVAILDERDRSMLTDWLASLATATYMSPYGYLQHLTQVVTAIARLGGAVIVGRGSHLILRPAQALRVLVVAPLAARIECVAARGAIGRHEAEQRIAVEEAERQAFLKRYFHADAADHSVFDVVVNTAALGVPGAVQVVRGALVRPAA
jgi:cytidylate kinase